MIYNKKGQTSTVFNIFYFIIVTLVSVLFIGGLIYVTGLLNGVFTQVGVNNDLTRNSSSPGYVNLTLASNETFGVLNNSVQSLYMVAGVYVLALAASIIITNIFMKMHPLWFFAYMLIAVLAVIFSAPVSNAYQSILASNIYGGNLAGFTIPNFVLINLPIIVMVIGVLGGIFLFINMIRTGDERNLG
jgi:Flp pilus assembly pilin Flp